MRHLILLLIKIYQKVFSPWMGQHCRFYPTCSCYAHEAVSKYGSLKGSWMAIRRLSRCHPWSPGGIDPVPESKKPELKEKA